MNTHSSKTPNKDVVDNDRPRTRPRGRGGVGRPYYIGADHPLPPALPNEVNRPRSTDHVGGKHRASVGISTRDTPEVALFWFNFELQQYAGQADVAW